VITSEEYKTKSSLTEVMISDRDFKAKLYQSDGYAKKKPALQTAGFFKIGKL
jgi:hypothetical protein